MKHPELFDAMGQLSDRLLDEAAGTGSFAKKKRVWPRVLSSLAALFAVCILVLNFVPTVAVAAANVPGLGELADKLIFLPSTRACLENEYQQPVDASQSDSGITVQVNSLVVDEAQVVILCSIETDRPYEFIISPRFRLLDNKGKELDILGGAGMRLAEDLFAIQFDLPPEGAPLPEAFTLELALHAGSDKDYTYSEETGYVFTGTEAKFTLPIDMDSSKVLQPQVYPVDQEVVLEGQRVTIEQVVVYPTKTLVYLHTSESNSAVVCELDMYLEDSAGNQYHRPGNTSFPTETVRLPSGFTLSEPRELPLESCFFRDAQGLTLHITSLQMVEKEKAVGTVSYKNKTVTNLPAGVTVSRMEKEYKDLVIWFHVANENRNRFYTIAISADSLTYEGHGCREAEDGILSRCLIPDFREGESTVLFQSSADIPLSEEIVIPLNENP